MRELESIYTPGEGWKNPEKGWVYKVSREDDANSEVLSLYRPWAPNRPIKFRSCASLVYGDYVGAGCLGRANIAAISRDLANVGELSMSGNAFAPYYGFDPRNGSGGSEASDAYHRFEGLLQYGYSDTHQLWIREDRWVALELDSILDYAAYDDDALFEAETKAQTEAWDGYVASDILRDLKNKPGIDEMRGDALITLSKALKLDSNDASTLEELYEQFEGDAPRHVQTLVLLCIRNDEGPYPEWEDEPGGMYCVNIEEIAEKTHQWLVADWPRMADEARKAIAKEAGQMDLL